MAAYCLSDNGESHFSRTKSIRLSEVLWTVAIAIDVKAMILAIEVRADSRGNSNLYFSGSRLPFLNTEAYRQNKERKWNDKSGTENC